MNRSLAKHLLVSAVILALMTASTISSSDASLQHTANGDHADHKEHGGNETHSHDAHEAHGVHVAHLQFSYVEQPLILSLFLIAVVLIKIGQSYALLLLACYYLLLLLLLIIVKLYTRYIEAVHCQLVDR